MRIQHFNYLLFTVLIMLTACSKENEMNVLVFSKTEAFRHQSIEAGREAFDKMAKEKGFNVVFSENAEMFNNMELKNFQAVVFLNTTGDVLNNQQQDAFERFIQAGGGYVGIHAATDTEYDWPWYGGLVGAYFLSHPNPENIQKGEFRTAQQNHWSTGHMPHEFEWEDEFYSYKNISSSINVVLEIDGSSYDGATSPDFHPISWYHEYDGGKAFYTGLGHTDEAFSDPMLIEHIWAGLQFVTGGDNPKSLDYSKARPEENRFTKVVLADKLDEPMELAVLDENRILFIQRKGEVRLFNTQTNELKTIAKIPVNLKYVNKDGKESFAEDGLLGLNRDPDFHQNQWVYLYYSSVGESRNVLSRFEMKGDELILDSEIIMLEIPTQREECCHTGGSIAWDKDGNLYLSTGDNSNPHGSEGYSPSDERPGRSPWDAQGTSANTNDLRGKILRIKPQSDGTYTIPEGNLYPQGTPQTRPEIYTMGHRNPFRIAIDQKSGFLYWGDVGPDANNSDSTRGPAGLDEVGQARSAGNQGWPHFVGENKAYHKFDFQNKRSLEKWDPLAPVNTSPNNTGKEKLPPALEAFIWYPYGESEEFPLVGAGGRNAMAGPVFYSQDLNKAERAFPSYYDGKLFIYEWMRGWIMAVSMDEDGKYKNMERFMPSYRFSNPMDMEFAANGDLYMLEYGSGWFTANDDARLIRIEYNSGNRKPQLQMAANQMGGAVPFKLELSAAGTFDADYDELKYSWEITDGKGFKKSLKSKDTEITLDKVGVYKVVLTVDDGKGGAISQSMEVTAGNEPPVLSLNLPGGNRSFYVPNTEIDYVIEVTDKEDGNLGKGIDHAAVAVSIDYLPQGFDKIQIAQGHREADASALFATGKTLIEGSDCMACHKKNEKSIGPSYIDIAQKYKGQDNSLEYLAGKIISGGAGVWGETAMSAHPTLSSEEAAEMTKYILSLGDEKPAEEKFATSGSFVATVPTSDEGKGVYIIRAAYQDRGANGLPPLYTEQTFILQSSNMDVHVWDEYIDVNKMSYGGNKFVIPSRSGAYMVLKDIDLQELSHLKLNASAPKSQLNAIGGYAELRLDSPSGSLIGQSEFLEASDGMNLGSLQIPIKMSAPANGKKQDVYLVFKNDTDNQGSLMVISGLEFKMLREKPIVQAKDTGSSSKVKGVNFFKGKWDLLITGTPTGDTRLIAEFSQKGESLTGRLVDPTGENPAIPVSSIEDSPNQIKFQFHAQGFDIKVELNKVDQNNLKGKMMQMFDATAKRIN